MWQEKEECLKFIVACDNYHTILTHGTKRNWAKRETEKLLNSNIHLRHCFHRLLSEARTHNEDNQQHFITKGYYFTMPVLPPMAITDHAPNFAHVPHKSLHSFLPPYPLLLLFLAPFCPSTSLLQHQWASVWSLHSLNKSWVLFTQAEMSSTSTVNQSKSRIYTVSIQYAPGWKKDWYFIEEHRKKHPVRVSQRRRFWGDLVGALQHLKRVYKRDGERLLDTFPTCCRKNSTNPP